MILPALVVLLGVAVLVGLCSEEGGARTITVDDDGEGDYATIKDAVDNATDGDTIRIWDGNYTGRVEVNKTLRIIGNGTEKIKINDNMRIKKENCILENLAFVRVPGDWALSVGYADNLTIRNCLIKESHTGIVGGEGTTNITILNSTLQNCSIAGILAGFSESQIINCVFENNERGILESGNRNTVEMCIFRNNSRGVAIVEDARESTVNNCIFERNNLGIFDAGKDTTLRSNVFINNSKDTKVNKEDPWYLSFEARYCYFVLLMCLSAALFVWAVIWFGERARNVDRNGKRKQFQNKKRFSIINKKSKK